MLAFWVKIDDFVATDELLVGAGAAVSAALVAGLVTALAGRSRPDGQHEAPFVRKKFRHPQPGRAGVCMALPRAAETGH